MSYTRFLRVTLEGEELEHYGARMKEEAERRAREKAEAAAAALAAAQEAADRDEAMMADSDDDEIEDFDTLGGGSGGGGGGGGGGAAAGGGGGGGSGGGGGGGAGGDDAGGGSSSGRGGGDDGGVEPEFGRFSHDDARATRRQQRQRQQFDYKPLVRRMGEYGQPIRMADFGLTMVYDPTNPEFSIRERMEVEERRDGDADVVEEDTDDDEVCVSVVCA